MANQFDYTNILNSFLQEVDGYLQKISIQVNAASQSSDNKTRFEEIYRAAHTIVGSAAMMELHNLSQSATAIEKIAQMLMDGTLRLDGDTLALLQRSLQRLKKLLELIKMQKDDSGILAENKQDFSAFFERRPQIQPLQSSASGGNASSFVAASEPALGASAAVAQQKTAFESDSLPLLTAQHNALLRSVKHFAGIIETVRNSIQKFETDRAEYARFTNGQQNSVERLEEWLGPLIGIDLKTSSSQVRNLLPLTTLWVVSARMKQYIDTLQTAMQNAGVYHDNLMVFIRNFEETMAAMQINLQQFPEIDPSISAVAEKNMTAAAYDEDAVREEIRARIEIEERKKLEIKIRKEILDSFSPNRSANLLTLSSDIGNEGLSHAQKLIKKSVDSEALDIFRAEADEHLRAIADGLFQLEKNPANEEALISVRRAAHTLKGAAAVVGVSDLADLAHSFEDLLVALSDHTMTMTPAIITLMLDTLQALEAIALGEKTDLGNSSEIAQAFHQRYNQLFGAPAQRSAASERTIVKLDAAAYLSPQDEEQGGEDLKDSDLIVRLPLSRIDELTNMFSDLLVNRNSVGDSLSRLERHVDEVVTASDKIYETAADIERNYDAISHTPFGFNQAAPKTLPFVYPNQRQQDTSELHLERYDELYPKIRSLSEGAMDIHTIIDQISESRKEIASTLKRENQLSANFQDALIKTRLVPFSMLEHRLVGASHTVAQKYGKDVNIVFEGASVKVDRKIFEDVSGPLIHLVRNAAYHGIKTPEERIAAGKDSSGTIVVRFSNEGNNLIISVSDDGQGLDVQAIKAAASARGLISADTELSSQEIIRLIFSPGFSTSESVTEEGGRGIGLDVVHDAVTKLHGTVEVESAPGEGTAFTLRIPTSIQLKKVLMVMVSGQMYALPAQTIKALQRIDKCYRFEGGTELAPDAPKAGSSVPACAAAQMASYVGLHPAKITGDMLAIFIHMDGVSKALIVDAEMGHREIVSKDLGPHLKYVPHILGATTLGTGQVALIIDVISMLKHPAGKEPAAVVVPDMQAARDDRFGSNDRIQTPKNLTTPYRNPSAHMLPYILVVDDSPSVRRAVCATLSSVGWETQQARDGQEALEAVAQRTPAAILLDIEMPRMDGFAFMTLLRKQKQFENVPIIMLTSRSAPKHSEHALQMGASEYIIKPYQDEELLNKISALTPVRPNGLPK